MGTIPIPVIFPLTVGRSDEPVLEPTLPISRVHESPSEFGDSSGEGYAPNDQRPAHEEIRAGDVSPLPLQSADPMHNVNLFA